MQKSPISWLIDRWNHMKNNGTAYVAVLLTAGFIWAQWPSRSTSNLPEVWVQHQADRYSAQFETEPHQDSTVFEGKTATLYSVSRKGIDFMLQDIRPGTDDAEQWVSRSQQVDLSNFGGELAMEWQFQSQGQVIYEYALTNDNHFVNQVRILVTPDYILKWAVGFKEKDDPEQITRILAFLDSVELQ